MPETFNPMKDTIFPINNLNINITSILKRIVSANIHDEISKGLNNSINLIDEGSSISDCAYISYDDTRKNATVTLSSAFCQLVWLIDDIGLKYIDANTIRLSCKEFGIDNSEYTKITQYIVNHVSNDSFRAEVESECAKLHIQFNDYINFLKNTLQLLDYDDLIKQIKNEVALVRRLRGCNELFCKEDFSAININGRYESLTNSAYCFGITFVLLHELSHFQLQHNLSEAGSLQEEMDADLSAFWSIYSDLTGREKFSAIVGILCLLFSLLFLNPNLESDGIHPREDRRIFYIYDQIKDDNPKFTVLVVYLFEIWAELNNVSDFPSLVDNIDENIKAIREYFESK